MFLSYLSPREVLEFNYTLRHPEGSAEDRKQATEEVLAALDLTHCADSRLGGSGASGQGASYENQGGTSGGEKRRVSLGIELLSNPAVIYLDEPITGLDSHNAYHLTKYLRKLTRERGISIVATIHSPSYKSLLLFDNLMVLSSGWLAFEVRCIHMYVCMCVVWR